jgi:hypothetical protein
MKKTKIYLTRSLTAIVFLIIVFTLSSCFRPLYKVSQVPLTENNQIQDLIGLKSKHVVVNFNAESKIELSNIKIDNGAGVINANYNDVPIQLEKYINKVKNKNLGYYSRKKIGYMDLLNLYVDEVIMDNNSISIPFSSISRAEYFETANGATTVSYIVSSAASAVGALSIFLLIACNCPYVYADIEHDGALLGNLYPGSVYPNLERTDYMLLKDIKPTDKNFKFTFANNRSDDLYTNSLELLIVEHQQNIEVIPSQDGVLHSISAPCEAESVGIESTDQYLEELKSRDGKVYSFDQLLDNDNLSSIQLNFEKKDVTQAKLHLNLKNSPWSAYTYNEICKNLGTLYPNWQQKQMAKDGGEVLEGSIRNGVQMQVLLKTSKGWTYVDHINTVGSNVFRDIVVPINLSDIEGDKIEILLKAGFMFWELDYAAFDFTEDLDLTIESLKPFSAKDSSGHDYTTELLAIDDLYMNQKSIGEDITVEFRAIDFNTDLTYTLILKGSGYYIRQNTYNSKPDYAKLVKLKRDGGFSIYSKDLYDQLVKTYVTAQ